MSKALVLGARPPFMGPKVSLSEEVMWKLVLVCDPPIKPPVTDVRLHRFDSMEAQDSSTSPILREPIVGGIVRVELGECPGIRSISVIAAVHNGDS